MPVQIRSVNLATIRRIVFTKVLNRPTLVLNRNWQAVNVATVARALVLLWNESARVVEPPLRTPRRADRELVEVHQRGLLERRAGEVEVTLLPASGLGAFSYTGVLLGEQTASKPVVRGSTPRTRAYCRRGST